VVLKYKNKTYDSNDLPIFLYFKKNNNKRDFINTLSNYNEFKNFTKFTSIDVAIAGNTVIKDKRSSIYIKFETKNEKQCLQRHIFNESEESNAIISSPGDIGPTVLGEWIERHIDHLI